MKALKMTVYSGVALGATLGSYQLMKTKKAVVSSKPVEERHVKENILDHMKLVNVQSFFRHGARTPIHCIETIEPGVYDKCLLMGDVPHTMLNYEVKALDGGPRPFAPMERSYRRKLLKGGCYGGQLTKLGQDQMYVFGISLRKEYVDKHKLLSAQCNPSEIYARSSNIARTIESMRCTIAGLYRGAHMINLQEPAAILVSDAANEILYPNTFHCPALKQCTVAWIQRAWDMEPMKTLNREVQRRSNYTEESGKFLNLINVRDDLIARQVHGIKIPNNLEELLPDIDKYATLIANIQLSGPPEERHLDLAVGPVLQLIQDNIDQSEQSAYKLFLYSSHDSMILPLAVSLGIFDDKWVPYAGDVRIECYMDSIGDKYVRALYCGREVTMTDCDTGLVPLARFKQVIAPHRLAKADYDNICGTQAEDLKGRIRGDDLKTTVAGM